MLYLYIDSVRRKGNLDTRSALKTLHFALTTNPTRLNVIDNWTIFVYFITVL